MHLYYIEEETFESIIVSLDLIPKVKDFANVFHETTGLPSSREIEFV